MWPSRLQPPKWEMAEKGKKGKKGTFGKIGLDLCRVM
jgi:hypothetical protein